MSGDELGQFAVAIYAASVDPPDTNAAFAKQLELGYPILSDPGKDVARAFGVLAAGKEYASRTTFIIGKDGTILEIMRDVNPATHGKDVAARLAALGIPRRSPAESASARPH